MNNQFTEMAQPWSMAAPGVQNLPIDPNHPFYYRHWPATWDFKIFKITKSKKTVECPLFLPSVDMERVVPGVNGVHQIRNEIGDASSRMGKLRQQGHIILEPTEHDYIRVYPAKYGGKHHAPKWQNFRVLAGQVISKFDIENFDQWRIQLVIDRIIPLPDPHFMELYVINARKEPARLIPSQHLTEVKKELDQIYKKIRDMEEAMAKIQEKGIAYYQEILNG